MQLVPALGPHTCYSVFGFPSRKDEFTEAQDSTYHMEWTVGAATQATKKTDKIFCLSNLC